MARLKSQMGAQTVTLSYFSSSAVIGSMGISYLCMAYRPHHQKPSVPPVRSVERISYSSAPVSSAASQASFFT